LETVKLHKVGIILTDIEYVIEVAAHLPAEIKLYLKEASRTETSLNSALPVSKGSDP
jgi:hypothetical protein